MAAIIRENVEQQINKTEYKELVNELLTSMVNDNNSPFTDVVDKYSDYLDKSNDLDATQKAGAMAGFLRETYAAINQQAMAEAMTLMTTNAKLKYDSYGIVNEYNMGLEKAEQMKIDTEIAAIAKVVKQSEAQAMAQKVVNDKLDGQIKRAQLEKQYGVVPNVHTTRTQSNGSYSKLYNGETYVANSSGDYLDAAGAVTTTPADYVPAVYSSQVIEDVTLVPTTTEGAIDKQIKGYDLVNYKDALKTMDQRTALMQNAKIPETTNEAKTRVSLIEAIVSGAVPTVSKKADGTMHD